MAAVGSKAYPKGIWLDFECNKIGMNRYSYKMKFWHYKREQSSWETWNHYGQRLKLELNGRLIRQEEFKFGKGYATYWYPNIKEVSGEFTITGNTTVTYRTTCAACEDTGHQDDYSTFNFTWGSINLTYENPHIIPGKPSASISFDNSNHTSYNGYNNFIGVKNDGTTPNVYHIHSSTGTNGQKLKIYIERSQDRNNWSAYYIEGNPVQTSSKTNDFTVNEPDRNYYYRYRAENFSSTNDLTNGDWNYYRLNAIPLASDRVKASYIEESNFHNYRFYNGIKLTIPSMADTEQAESTLTYTLYYSTKATPSSSWSSWVKIGDYSASTKNITVKAEDYIKVGEYIKFAVKPKDNLEYGKMSNDSATYQRNNQPPSKPLFTNVENGKIYVESLKPIISANKDYNMYPEIFTIEYSIDGGSFVSTSRQGVSGSYLYMGSKTVTGYSSHTIQARATNKINGLVTLGDKITFTLVKSEKPNPVIINVEEGKTYLEATPGLKNDPKISAYESYLNGEVFKMGTTITKTGSYNIKVIATHYITGEQGEAQVNFKVDNRRPDPIEVYGVFENDIRPTYTIHVIKQSSSNMVIKLNNSVITAKNDKYSDGRASYSFIVNKKGNYSLNVVATHKTSTLTREFNIKKFTVAVEEVNEDLIRFKPTNGPTHSAKVILDSGSPIHNKVSFKVNNSSEYYYSSPLLIFGNDNIYGRDTNRSNLSAEDNKIYNGFINYVPEIPTINGTTNGRVHNTPVNITFNNNASKPNQAGYKVFIDGKLVDDPFNTTSTVNTDGYHCISILCYDTVNPYSYRFHSIKFLLKAQVAVAIRQPYIIAYRNKKDKYVDVKVKFSSLNSDFKHSITITKGTEVKTTNYNYDVKTVSLRIDYNCTITAKTELVESKVSKSNTKIINTVFDTAPTLDNIKLLGVNKYNINGTTYKLGRECTIVIPKKYNETYKVFVNGAEYKEGTIITNKEEEIKKYAVEVILINEAKPQFTSYFSDSFYLDSINPASPILMNLTSNLMNKKTLPFIMKMKSDNTKSNEKYILNNRIIDIKTNMLTKDDEYILTVTYTYYDNTIRSNTFYFSINSNPVDNIKPLRVILKTLDYNNSDKASENELIIDRDTGNIYYNSESNKIVPITKNIEDRILEVEKQLIKVEDNHNFVQGVKFCIKDMTEYLEANQNIFKTRLNEYKNTFDMIKARIDQTIKDIDYLEDLISNNGSFINSILTKIKGEKANLIKEETNKVISLNDKFKKLCVDLRSTFSRAAVCTQKTYILQEEIAKRVSKTDFETFKKKENDKYDKFVKDLYDAGVR